jgi:hypothetical protein
VFPSHNQSANVVREIIAVWSRNNEKHVDTLCGHNAELFVLNLVIYICIYIYIYITIHTYV